MVFLSFFNTNLVFFALGAYKLKFSGYAYADHSDVNSSVFYVCKAKSIVILLIQNLALPRN